jgi:hypothetical protein
MPRRSPQGEGGPLCRELRLGEPERRPTFIARYFGLFLSTELTLREFHKSHPVVYMDNSHPAENLHG